MNPLPSPGALTAIIAGLSRPVARRAPQAAVARCQGQTRCYELLDVVHTGSACCVFRAREETGRVVAIKALLDQPAQGLERARIRFQNEVQVLKTLCHPHIVPALDEGMLAGRPFFVMEYAERGSLGQAMRARPIEPIAASHYLLEVLDALAYTHACGIIHRDVKPDNILVDDNDVARLVDFGIALLPDRSLQPACLLGENLGTPSYIPPEQLADPGSVGIAADLFSVGASLYALLTGGNPLSLVSRVHRKVALQALPKHLAAVVEVSTRPHPADRYQDASQMAMRLADALEHL